MMGGSLESDDNYDVDVPTFLDYELQHKLMKGGDTHLEWRMCQLSLTSNTPFCGDGWLIFPVTIMTLTFHKFWVVVFKNITG